MNRWWIAASVVAIAGCGGLSQQSSSTTPVDYTRKGPIIGTANAYALAPPPAGLASGTGGTALGWSGKKKKSKDPLPSYAAAMLEPAELGDLTNEGDEEHLRSETVAEVMNTHVNDIFDGCVIREMRKTKFNRVAIQMVISGKGKVSGATTKPGSKPFQRCVARKLLTVEFPKFSAPRMGAEYAFRVE